MEIKSSDLNKIVMDRVRKRSHLHNYSNKEGQLIISAINTVIKNAIKNRAALNFGAFIMRPNLVAYKKFLRSRLMFFGK